MKKHAIVHRHLRLQHHRHSGRLLHHRHTSYRGLAVIFALSAVLMFTLSSVAQTTAATMAEAGTLTVTASNPAPLPTIAAVTTNPPNNAVVRNSPVEVSGTCQITGPPAHIITVLDNGAVAGSTPCQNDGIFSLSVALTPGQHTLIAQTYNITDGMGPESEPVVVTYIKPESSKPSTGGSGRNSNEDQEAEAAPVIVTADRSFIIFGPEKDAVWTGTINGGKLPYKIYIDWGDGNADTYTVTESGEQYFVHRYYTMRPYVITLRVTDAADHSITRQYAAATPYLPPITSTTTGNPWNTPLVLGLYGAYLLTLVVFGAVWARLHPSTYMLIPVPVRRKQDTKRSYRTKRYR